MPRPFHKEPHAKGFASRLNWLRAAVLGANDGIVSVAALVVGVAGATSNASEIFITGIAGLLAGALSMAAGEYVSVSSQRDSELALIAREKTELTEEPEEEMAELVGLYKKKGLTRETAEQVVRELSARNAFAAHAETELHIDPEALTNPWHAALASSAAFTTGAIVPLLAIILPPAPYRIGTTFAAVVIALAGTGALSARISGTKIVRVTMRVVLGGALAMVVTFGIGHVFGVATS